MLDPAVGANARAVEHYEICRYRTIIAWAEELATTIVRFLTTNLNEEKAANTKSTAVLAQIQVAAGSSGARAWLRGSMTNLWLLAP
ncbi:ferritin-like metal-binding protein YciE [Bradyrhizobium sp. LA7.1]